MVQIVKRRGKKEKFDERKVYGSVCAACMAAEIGEQKCEKVAEAVAKEIRRKIRKKKEITSDEIFRSIVKTLRKHNKDAAFLYETHRDVS